MVYNRCACELYEEFRLKNVHELQVIQVIVFIVVGEKMHFLIFTIRTCGILICPLCIFNSKQSLL